MKKILLILLLVIAGTTIYAQDSGSLSKKEVRQLLKEERKNAAAREAELMAAYIDSLMKNNAFVLEADMLFDRYGNSIPVASNLNFVMFDSVYSVFQIGNSFYIGSNGVGGVTYEGSVNSYRKTKNEKNGTYNITYTLVSSLGSFDINFFITTAGKGDATVRGNFSGSVRYSGYIVGLRESKVFKGTSY
jgi:hypothetical protein